MDSPLDRFSRRAALFAVPVTLFLLAGGQTAYYGAMEKLGYEKHDLLVGSVEDARGAQE